MNNYITLRILIGYFRTVRRDKETEKEGKRRQRRDREGDKTERTECPTMAAKLTAYAIVADRGQNSLASI